LRNWFRFRLEIIATCSVYGTLFRYIYNTIVNLNLLMVKIVPIHSSLEFIRKYIRKYIWRCKTIRINVCGTLVIGGCVRQGKHIAFITSHYLMTPHSIFWSRADAHTDTAPCSGAGIMFRIVPAPEQVHYRFKILRKEQIEPYSRHFLLDLSCCSSFCVHTTF
jgi:hypothetical protein